MVQKYVKWLIKNVAQNKRVLFFGKQNHHNRLKQSGHLLQSFGNIVILLSG